MLSYYSRPEIKELILMASRDKEVGVKYNDKFGKRPDVLQFESDIEELAKQGATSFHISEESWYNPLDLKTGMTRNQLDNLRKGWDLVFDIDSPNLEHSKIIAKFIIEALKFHDVSSIFVKYSGNKGFHIVIPFEAFPEKINNVETRLMFPEAPRAIIEYITEMVKKHALEAMPDKSTQDIELDSILVSSRHMYRCPYSLHEKTGLVSIPISPEKIMEFDKSQAKPENVNIKMPFPDREKIKQPDAEKLLLQALDWHSKKLKIKELKEQVMPPKSHADVTEKIPERYFPPSIKKGLQGLKDGKKRFLFILINFLKCIGWSMEDIEKKVKEWNSKNPEPLREGYILSQLSWHKRQKEKIPPPNYTSTYYKDLMIEDPETITKKFKNPVNYTISLYKYSKKLKK
jgi:DNA primase catalytic subunit